MLSGRAGRRNGSFISAATANSRPCARASARRLASKQALAQALAAQLRQDEQELDHPGVEGEMYGATDLEASSGVSGVLANRARIPSRRWPVRLLERDPHVLKLGQRPGNGCVEVELASSTRIIAATLVTGLDIEAIQKMEFASPGVVSSSASGTPDRQSAIAIVSIDATSFIRTFPHEHRDGFFRAGRAFGQ